MPPPSSLASSVNTGSDAHMFLFAPVRAQRLLQMRGHTRSTCAPFTCCKWLITCLSGLRLGCLLAPRIPNGCCQPCLHRLHPLLSLGLTASLPSAVLPCSGVRPREEEEGRDVQGQGHERGGQGLQRGGQGHGRRREGHARWGHEAKGREGAAEMMMTQRGRSMLRTLQGSKVLTCTHPTCFNQNRSIQSSCPSALVLLYGRKMRCCVVNRSMRLNRHPVGQMYAGVLGRIGVDES